MKEEERERRNEGKRKWKENKLKNTREGENKKEERRDNEIDIKARERNDEGE